jgi:hypothetical protein
VAPVNMFQCDCGVKSESRQGVEGIHGCVLVLGSTSWTCDKSQTYPLLRSSHVNVPDPECNRMSESSGQRARTNGQRSENNSRYHIQHSQS